MQMKQSYLVLNFAFLLAALPTTTYANSSCPSFLCAKDAHCARGECKSGFCAARQSVILRPAGYDPLGLGVTELRITDFPDGPRGSFQIEGLRANESVVGIAWNYVIEDDVETRTIVAYRGAERSRLEYNQDGIVEDTLTQNERFTQVLRWFISQEETDIPFWMGTYFAGDSELTLITKPCTSCTGDWCTCTDTEAGVVPQ